MHKHGRTPKYIKQLLTDLKGEIDKNTITVGASIPHLQLLTDYPGRKSIRNFWP